MHPLMSLTELTDVQIMEKLQKVGERLGMARSCNMNSQLIDQMQLIMITYQMELAKRNEPPIDKTPVAWDMDTYLEDARNDSSAEEEEDIPRWQSTAFDEFDDTSDDEGGGSFLD